MAHLKIANTLIAIIMRQELGNKQWDILTCIVKFKMANIP